MLSFMLNFRCIVIDNFLCNGMYIYILQYSFFHFFIFIYGIFIVFNSLFCYIRTNSWMSDEYYCIELLLLLC